MKTNAIQIQPIGEYFQNDQNGYVINPSSLDKIPLRWLPVIEAVKKSYLDQLGDQLHSIYLRGSLVRGFDVDGFSDMDSFAVLKVKNLRWEDASWTNELKSSLSAKYGFIREIELMLTSILDSNLFENPNLPMIIKTQSLCIFGEDLSHSIPRFRPDKSMMLNYRWIASDFNAFMANEDRSETDYKKFLKILIRTGYEIIMEKEGKFTPDLYLCFKSFSKYFPEWQWAMEKALFCYLNLFEINVETIQIIKELSNWLIEKVKTHLM